MTIPAKTLILIRHAQPESYIGVDEKGPALSECGEQQAIALGKKLAELMITDAAVWVSPLRRAHQTLEGICKEWDGAVSHKEHSLLVPFADVHKLETQIDSFLKNEDVLVIVSHQPLLGDLLVSLSDISPRNAGIKQGTLVILKSSSDPSIKFSVSSTYYAEI